MWQRCAGIKGGSHGELQRLRESFPDQQQLGLGVLQLGHKTGVYAGPIGIARECLGFALPVRHIGGQGRLGGLGIGPGFGGKHFNALRQQHRSFTLHLHPVLQVFNGTHALNQLGFEPSQRLFAQRCAGFGGIALPGQGIGQVELGQGQQSLGFVGPFQRNGGLGFAAFDVIKLFTHKFGGAFVFDAEFFEHLLQLLAAGAAGQPLANASHAFARGVG